MSFLPKFKWYEGDTLKFSLAMNSPLISEQIANHDFKANTIDDNVNFINGIYIASAKLASLFSSKFKKKSGPKKEKPKKSKWFTEECKKAKLHLRQLSRLLCNPLNQFSRYLNEQYFFAQKRYRSLCKRTKSLFIASAFKSLESLRSSNPSKFWEIYHGIVGVDTHNTLTMF